MGRNKAEEKNRQSGRQGAGATLLESPIGECVSWRRQYVQRPCSGERRGLRQSEPERQGEASSCPVQWLPPQVGRSQVGERPHVPENRSPFWEADIPQCISGARKKKSGEGSGAPSVSPLSL